VENDSKELRLSDKLAKTFDEIDRVFGLAPDPDRAERDKRLLDLLDQSPRVRTSITVHIQQRPYEPLLCVATIRSGAYSWYQVSLGASRSECLVKLLECLMSDQALYGSAGDYQRPYGSALDDLLGKVS
jgi:hypothetical protein